MRGGLGAGRGGAAGGLCGNRKGCGSGQQSESESNSATSHVPGCVPFGGTHSSSSVVQPRPFLLRNSVRHTSAPPSCSPRPSCTAGQ